MFLFKRITRKNQNKKWKYFCPKRKSLMKEISFSEEKKYSLIQKKARKLNTISINQIHCLKNYIDGSVLNKMTCTHNFKGIQVIAVDNLKHLFHQQYLASLCIKEKEINKLDRYFVQVRNWQDQMSSNNRFSDMIVNMEQMIRKIRRGRY